VKSLAAEIGTRTSFSHCSNDAAAAGERRPTKPGRRTQFEGERPMGKLPREQDPRETSLDDPRRQTDWPTHKQTNEPWKGNPEKDQLDPNRPDIDLERWQESNTH
jgi:hypothetical protein